jgi:hypothetical protein
LGRGIVAIQYPGSPLFGCLLAHCYPLIRLIETESLFTYHAYGVRWTYLCAYATAFAVFHVYLDGHGFGNNSIRTVEPAQKTGGLVLSGHDTLFHIYHWKRVTPFASLPCLANSRR